MSGKKINEWKDKMNHLGIKNKTLLLVSSVIVAFVFAFVFIFSIIISGRLAKESITYSKDMLENLENTLVSYFDEISAIANEPNYDYHLQNYLHDELENHKDYGSISSSRTMQDYEMSSQLFREEVNQRTDISSIFIFGEKRVLLHRSIYQLWSIVRDYSLEEWYSEAVKTENGYAVTGPHKHDFLRENKEETISVSRKITSYEDGSILGVMMVDLNLNKIEEICSAYYPQNDGSFYLISEDGKVVLEQNGSEGQKRYHLSDEKTSEDFSKNMAEQEGAEWKWKYDGEKYQVVTRDVEKTGWKVVSITPVASIQRSMYESVAAYIFIGIGILLLIILILNLLLKRVVKPIVTLADKMDLADGGNLDIQVPVETYDETGRLSKSFNKMLKRINLLMNQVVEEQEEKRKYEFQMLQAQINPHFLYNTLDSIIWMAEMKDDSVVPMTEALAKLFRISLNKGNEFITIGDEMEHVRNYLVIQGMRYEGKFEYFIQMTEEAAKFKTVKLIVQPIVENCIYHGIKKMKGKGMILISALCTVEDVIIKVTDNGAGMEEKVCEEILTKESRFENSSGSGIGVKNVNERIKLYFGENYGLSYESQIGKGTTVTIKLPKLTDCEVNKE